MAAATASWSSCSKKCLKWSSQSSPNLLVTSLPRHFWSEWGLKILVEALNPRAGHEIYGASKAALDVLTRSASRAHAPMRVLGLRLGLIGRDGIDQAWPEGVAAWKAATPLARYATAEEVVGVTEFLLSDANSWATGSTYDFDGGLGANSW